MGKDKTPAPMVTLTPKGLIPMDATDAENIASDPMGTEYDLVKRSKRRWRQLRTYWKALHLVVQNDERWPSAEHLHDDLKYSCNYVRNVVDLQTGDIGKVVDSVAFDKMTQDEFNKYMETAMGFLAKVIGYDPLMFLNEAA